MPGPMSEVERQEFLAGRHVGGVSVARDDDRPPHSTPVWYAYEPGGNITFFTGTQGRRSRKAGLVREAGVLSFLVQREEFPYMYVTVEGTVVGEDSPPSEEQVLAVAGTCPKNRRGGSSTRSFGGPHQSSCSSVSGRTAG